MSPQRVYHDLLALVEQTLGRRVRKSTHAHLVWLLLGLLYGQSCHLSRMALVFAGRGLSPVLPESLLRRLRRTLQDGEVNQRCCLHPWARAHLALGQPQRLVVIVDAPCQEDRWIVLTVLDALDGPALVRADRPACPPGLSESLASAISLKLSRCSQSVLP